MTTRQIELVLLVAVGFFIFIYLIRSRRVYEKYVGTWILLAIIGVFFAVFSSIFIGLSKFLGFDVPSNFAFFIAVSVLIFLVFQISIDLTKMRNQLEALAIENSVLANKVEKIKNSQESF